MKWSYFSCFAYKLRGVDLSAPKTSWRLLGALGAPGCLPGASWVPWCLLRASWVSPGCSLGAQMSPRCLPDVSQMLPNQFNSIQFSSNQIKSNQINPIPIKSNQFNLRQFNSNPLSQLKHLFGVFRLGHFDLFKDVYEKGLLPY